MVGQMFINPAVYDFNWYRVLDKFDSPVSVTATAGCLRPAQSTEMLPGAPLNGETFKVPF